MRPHFWLFLCVWDSWAVHREKKLEIKYILRQIIFELSFQFFPFVVGVELKRAKDCHFFLTYMEILYKKFDQIFVHYNQRNTGLWRSSVLLSASMKY